MMDTTSVLMDFETFNLKMGADYSFFQNYLYYMLSYALMLFSKLCWSCNFVLSNVALYLWFLHLQYIYSLWQFAFITWCLLVQLYL